MKYFFYGSLIITLIILIINGYFGMLKGMYSWMYVEVINTACMTILFLGMAYEGYQKKKNKKS